MSFEPRTYRKHMASADLASFEVIQGETDLFISAPLNLAEAAGAAVAACRAEISGFIAHQPDFLTTLEPLAVPDDSPATVRLMAEAGLAAGVGPMAAVAGAVAEYVGRELLKYTDQVIVENGGDIFLAANKPRRLSVFAGDSPLSDKVIIVIRPDQTPVGVCTSSGTVGHSLSFGHADAAVALSKNCALADAWATRLGNLVKEPKDVKAAIETARKAPGLTGALIIKDDQLAVWGDIELAR
jgi:ApbE superfamily uncharacterized protein (UPF0280 family)